MSGKTIVVIIIGIILIGSTAGMTEAFDVIGVILSAFFNIVGAFGNALISIIKILI